MRAATSWHDSLPYSTLFGDWKNLRMLSRNSACGRNVAGRRCSRSASLTENRIPRCKPICSAVSSALVSGLESRDAGRNRLRSDARVWHRLIPSSLRVHSDAGRSGFTSGTECLMRTTIRPVSLNAGLRGPGAVLVVVAAWQRQQDQHDDPADQRH